MSLWDARKQVFCQVLRALEESALHNIKDFGPQALAGTLHAMAKVQYSTDPLVLEALER